LFDPPDFHRRFGRRRFAKERQIFFNLGGNVNVRSDFDKPPAGLSLFSTRKTPLISLSARRLF
jgi:hypothetical protein